MIVTQAAGAITYSVSDSVEEKGTIVNRKKLPVHVWSVCEEFAIKHKESRSSTDKQLYGYISIAYDENLTKIEAVVIYEMSTLDCPEGIWDFPIALIWCLCIHVLM